MTSSPSLPQICGCVEIVNLLLVLTLFTVAFAAFLYVVMRREKDEP